MEKLAKIVNRQANRLISLFVLSIWVFIIILATISKVNPDFFHSLPGQKKNKIDELYADANAASSSSQKSLAISIYQEIIALAPEKLEPKIQLARVYQQTGREELAISLLIQELSKSSNTGFQYIIYQNLAEIHHGNGSIDLYQSALKDALRTAPFPTLIQQNLGLSYLSQQRWNDAISIFQGSLENQKNLSTFYRASIKNFLFLEKQNKKNTLSLRRLGQEAGPENILSRFDSISYDHYLEHAPSLAKGHNNIGVAYANLKEFAKAKQAWIKSLAICRDCSDANDNLYRLLKLLRNP